MSNLRHEIPREADLLVRTWPTNHPKGVEIPFLYPDWNHLAYASEGTATVETPEGAWVLPSHRAVWVPAGVRHRVIVHHNSALRSLFFRAGLDFGASIATLGLSPLARELILHITAIAPLYKAESAHERLAAVLLDQLRELPVLPVYLPSPVSEIGVRALDSLKVWDRSIDEVCADVGTSRRTLERVFARETGMKLGTWRQQARLMEALRLLSQGESVGNVAFQIGYSSTSAFVYAFRRAFGVPPGAYYQ